MKYTNANEKSWNILSGQGYKWTLPIEHEDFLKAKNGDFPLYLTPSKAVPKDWLPDFKGLKVLGLASGGGQQGPVFTAWGADVTIFDLSDKQLEAEKMVAERENYNISIVKGDMTERFPFEDEIFDFIFHPVSNCYVLDIQHIWNECYRVLKKGGTLVSGFLTETGFLFDINPENPTMTVVNKMPLNPLKGLSDDEIKTCYENGEGFMFSHTLEEQIGGQIKAGLTLAGIYDDRERPDEFCGVLGEYMNTYAATKSVKLAPIT